MLMTLLTWSLVVIAGLVLALVVAGQLNLLGGATPEGLGVRDGRFKRPSRTENSVSSQADLHCGSDVLVDYARIAPLAGGGDPVQRLARIREIVAGMPGARAIESRPDYLYVQFTTRWLKFVDDVEFFADAAADAVQVRSASRVGSKDFGVNRARIEAIRARLAAGG